MSFIAQETQPLLNNPTTPTSNTPVSTSTPSRTRSTSRDPERAHPDPEQGEKEQSRTRMNIDAIGFGCVIAGLALFLPITQYLIFSNGGSKLGWFALHPTMQSLGITFAVLSIQSLQSTPSPSTSRVRAFKIHQILLLVLALPLFAIGVSSMWYNKKSHGADHFTSWHGLLGLIVVVWMITQALIGGISHSLSLTNPTFKSLYKYHRLSGYFLLPSILVVAHLGGSWSDWSVGHSSLGLRIAAFDVGLGLVAMGVFMRMRPSKMKFL